MKDSTKDKVQGSAHELKGAVKEKVGKATMEWAPKLRQPDKAQNSSNGEKSHESISKEFHEGV